MSVAAGPRAAAPTGGQLAPLVRLRWRMIRHGGVRAGLALLLLVGLGLLAAAVVVGLVVDRDNRQSVVLLLPTILAAFALLAFAAPIAAGGGNDLYPHEQLVAFPVAARTHYVAGLLLAPLNLAWFTQFALILGLVAFVLDDASRWTLLGLLPVVTFVVLMTLLGQGFAWLLVGIRQDRRGRLAVWVALAVAAAAAVVAVTVVGLTNLLDLLPTSWVVIGAGRFMAGEVLGGLAVQLPLLALCWLAYVGGGRACAWALGRTGDAGVQRDGRPLPRRSPPRSAFAALLATDRASVWRSVALRRGIYVLALLPGAVAFMAGLQWASLVLLPGLVAAGSGLLFGVNAFCLDGSGAVWLASQPLPARLAFWAKTRVLAEVCLAAVTVALVAGALRATDPPTPATVASAVGAALACSATVVATCMRWSVTRPHRAELRGSRDTPAPPGTMALYSIRLAVGTTLLGIAFSVLLVLGGWPGPVLLAVVVLLLSTRRLLASARLYDDPVVRSRVTATVSAG